jgi:hypothetical protein
VNHPRIHQFVFGMLAAFYCVLLRRIDRLLDNCGLFLRSVATVGSYYIAVGFGHLWIVLACCDGSIGYGALVSRFVVFRRFCRILGGRRWYSVLLRWFDRRWGAHGCVWAYCDGWIVI